MRCKEHDQDKNTPDVGNRTIPKSQRERQGSIIKQHHECRRGDSDVPTCILIINDFGQRTTVRDS